MIGGGEKGMETKVKLYIWCYIGEDIYPLGHAKSYEYAMSLSEKDYPEKYKLYELVEANIDGRE